jgi:hypothetical protein
MIKATTTLPLGIEHGFFTDHWALSPQATLNLMAPTAQQTQFMFRVAGELLQQHEMGIFLGRRVGMSLTQCCMTGGVFP